MSKHTPGPWRIAEGLERSDKTRQFIWSDADSREEREDGSFYCVATVNPRTDSAQLHANALLIAAAPALAEALQKFIDARSDRHGHTTMPIAEAAARAALAKAGL